MIDLTIIIPVYNTEQYLNRCFESIKPVKLNVEVIFVNDGSTDYSREILTQFATDCAYVSVIHQTNQGLSAARNTGIAAAKGEYFCLLDSDDWFDFDIIESLYEKAKTHNLDLLGFGLEHINNKNESIGSNSAHPIPYDTIITGRTAFIEGFQPSSACQFIYKTEFIKSNNITFIVGINQEDVEFTARMIVQAPSCYFTHLMPYKYFKNSNSMSQTKDEARLKNYLNSSVVVADLLRNNIEKYRTDKLICEAYQKKYNSVVWNLLLRFYKQPNEVDYQFKRECIEDLKQKKLYPLKGAMDTSFQKLSSVLMNIEPLYKFLLKRRASVS